MDIKILNSLFRQLKNSRGKRQALIENISKIGVEQFNESSNVTTLNKLLISQDYLENNEKMLLVKYLIDCTSLKAIRQGKSLNGNKTVKLENEGTKIVWLVHISLYDYQLNKIEKKVNPFTSEKLLDRLISLLEKSQDNGFDFDKAIKEAKKRYSQKLKRLESKK